MKLKPLEKLLLYLVTLLIHLISFPIFLELYLVLGVLFCFAFKVMVCLREISLVGGTEMPADIIPSHPISTSNGCVASKKQEAFSRVSLLHIRLFLVI